MENIRMKELIEVIKDFMSLDNDEMISEMKVYYRIRIVLASFILMILIILAIAMIIIATEQANMVNLIKHLLMHKYGCCGFRW